MDWVANLAVGAAVLLGGVATLLFVVGLVSWLRLRHGRLLWVSLAFLFLAVQGVLLTRLAYQDRAAIAAGDSSLTGLSLVGLGIVLALYLAVLKR
jgi:branched-subunit amino acid ABC-type transport system permease component